MRTPEINNVFLPMATPELLTRISRSRLYPTRHQNEEESAWSKGRQTVVDNTHCLSLGTYAVGSGYPPFWMRGSDANTKASVSASSNFTRIVLAGWVTFGG